MIASSAKQNQKGQTAALMLTEVAEVLADAEERRRSRGAPALHSDHRVGRHKKRLCHDTSYTF